MIPPHIKQLPEADQLYWLIGRVCQLDVNLEMALRHVYITLVSPSLAVFLVPSDISRMVTDCKRMLSKAMLDPDVIREGTVALEASSAAHRERNRLVHDRWIEAEIPEAWSPVGRSFSKPRVNQQYGPVPFSELAACLTNLGRSLIQVSVLGHVLWDELPFYKHLALAPPEPTLRETLRGEFDLNADYSYLPWSVRGSRNRPAE
jgi:hypothetical protein